MFQQAYSIVAISRHFLIVKGKIIGKYEVLDSNKHKHPKRGCSPRMKRKVKKYRHNRGLCKLVRVLAVGYPEEDDDDQEAAA